MPALDAAGRFLAFTQESPGRQEVRLLDGASGKETTLVASLARANVSPDGSRVAYGNRDGIFSIDRAGGDPVKLLDQNPKILGQIYGWHSQGITHWHGSPIRFSLLDPATRQDRELISHPTLNIHGAELSPDGKWMTFHIPGTAREPLYIAPVHDGKSPLQREWILVSDSPGLNRRGWWSADGNLLYLLSDRDGTMGIWAQRLGPDKRPQGPAFAVLRFPETRRSPGNQLGFARDRIVYPLRETSGNIWLAEANK